MNAFINISEQHLRYFLINNVELSKFHDTSILDRYFSWLPPPQFVYFVSYYYFCEVIIIIIIIIIVIIISI